MFLRGNSRGPKSATRLRDGKRGSRPGLAAQPSETRLPDSLTHSGQIPEGVGGGAWGGNAHMILVGYFSTVEGFRTGLILRWGVGGEKKINE